MILLLFGSLHASAARARVSKWVFYKGHYFYYNAKGQKVKDKIRKIGGSFYCFDKQGRVRTGFIRYGKQIYFANRRGKFATGWCTINKKKFYFSERGRALPGIQAVDGKKYCFSYRGELLKGWQIVDGKKYYFHSKTGEMVKNRTIGGVKINKYGVAPLSTEEKLKLKCNEILDQITTRSMSKAEKIRACYDYMSSRQNFSYTTWREFKQYTGWQADYAYEMLTRHKGNCYNFSCGFAYLAKALGCDVTIIRGRVHGTRDHEADGFTRHCWTMVDGLYYDVELSYADSADVYGASEYPLTHQLLEFVVLG